MFTSIYLCVFVFFFYWYFVGANGWLAPWSNDDKGWGWDRGPLRREIRESAESKRKASPLSFFSASFCLILVGLEVNWKELTTMKVLYSDWHVCSFFDASAFQLKRTGSWVFVLLPSAFISGLPIPKQCISVSKQPATTFSLAAV